jgi:hypothetical protein
MIWIGYNSPFRFRSRPPASLTHSNTVEFKGGASMMDSAKNLGMCELTMTMPAVITLESEGAVSFTLRIGNPEALKAGQMKFLVSFVTTMNRQKGWFGYVSVAVAVTVTSILHIFVRVVTIHQLR